MRPYEIGKYDEGYAFMNSLKEDSKKDHKGMETVKKHKGKRNRKKKEIRKLR